MLQLREPWEQLEAAPGATLFQSFRWNHLAARVFADEAPYVVFAETGSGRAIIPAAISREQGCVTLLGEALFDYRDVLHQGDDEALRLAWRQIAQLRLPVAFSGLRGVPGGFWKALQPVEFTRAPAVRPWHMSADEFARAHSRLGRQVRRLLRAGVELWESSGSDARLVRWIYSQKARQLAGVENNLFADPRRSDFMVAVAAMEAGACGLHCFRRGEDVVSCLLTLRDRDVVRFYTICFDAAWAHYSPGVALLFEITRRALDEGLDCDYMTGEQPHKLRLATDSVPLYRLCASADAVAAAVKEPARLAA